MADDTPASTAPTIVLTAPSAAPDAMPTAIASALDRLIVRDEPVNPLGAGDWRTAKAAIGAFYADRDFRPIWVDADGLTAAGRAALAQLRRAPEDGLTLTGLALPDDLVGPLDPEAVAADEVAVAAAVVAYAEQASGARLSPYRLAPMFAADPQIVDPGEALAEMAAASDPGARLAAFNPPQKGYRALREALQRANEAASGARQTESTQSDPAAASDAPALGDDPLLGAAYHPRTARGRRRADLASAATRTAGDARARERAAILANMEMWRWEPRDMGERRIEVNIPDYSVAVMEGDSVLMSSRVVVGKPETPTPVFSDRMRYVLINPSWEVPDSIIKKEILPRLDHFTRLGYAVKTVGSRVVVRQPPGEDNALGRLAFMFPNDHAVYLHDTPAREVFDADMRALSHGCVRVEDPERLAEIVLNWPEARLEAAIGGTERTVFLPQPLPIHIEYFTTFVDAEGALEERPDVYGLAQRVARILAATSQD
jgi:murein L,D-transpeptidase YcbB/YkuD